MKICPAGKQVAPSRWTDTTKLIVTFAIL